MKLKMYYKYLILIFILNIPLQVACMRAEWFDIKSDVKLTVPSSIQDFEYLLDEFVLMNQETPGLAEVGSDGHYTPNLNIPRPTEINTYTWTNSLANLGVVDWNNSYKRIFQCNLVLQGLEKITPGSLNEQSQYNSVKGNALFHRAKNYYDLAQIYGQPYKMNSAVSDLGIPLKEGIDITERSERASVKITYDQIIKDLLSAAEFLPKLPQLTTRGSKAGAFALLARTFLTMQDYEKAGAYSDSSLRCYNTLIDFNSISSSVANLGLFNAETIFYAQRTTAWNSTWRAGFVFVDQDLYALYDNNDLRKSRFFSTTGNSVVFKGNYNNSTAGFNGLATDEQYLIKSECLARSGNTSEAMKILDELRKKRWNNAVPFPESKPVDAEDALKRILAERRRELLFRNLRWVDLRRLNLDNRFKITISRTIDGKIYTLEPDSYKYTLPIPDDIVAFSGIPQNPGWEK